MYRFNKEKTALPKHKWAKNLGYELFHGQGEKNATYFNKIIKDENHQPIFKLSTWEKIIQSYRNGTFQPYNPRGELSGRIWNLFLFYFYFLKKKINNLEIRCST